MKLDPTVLRTMDRTDFRVLEAIELGQDKYQHEMVSLPQIHTLANLRNGGSHKIVSSLLRDKLISHERNSHNGMDGYRLTNAGYDILALHTMKIHHVIAAFGQKIGTGKESDIYLAATSSGQQVVLKFHRLGRTSFRNVRNKRDYFNQTGRTTTNRNQHTTTTTTTTHNWLFLSKLSAQKEYAFMKALYDVKYAVPQPIHYNRHVICMNLIRGIPLYQIQHMKKQLSIHVAQDIYEQAMTLISTLAIRHGLIHCDFNEYNLLVDLSGIQAIVTDDTADPYVRHSGQSVAPDAPSIGALSKQPWEQSLLEQQQEDHGNVEESLPEPVARLTNGEAKPVVTLIDFPQMISISHINAAEYYSRDVSCVQNFFQKKLSFDIPFETCRVTQYATWENVMKLCHLSSSNSSSSSISTVNNSNPTTTTTDKDTTRMDTTLRASGFSSSTANDRMLELYYFTQGPRPIDSAVFEEEEEEGEDDESDDSDDDEEEEEEEEKYDNDDANDIDKEEDDIGEIDLISLADSRASRNSSSTMHRFENLNLLTTYSSDVQVRREQITNQTKDRIQQQVADQITKQQRHRRPNHNNNKSITKQPQRNMNKSYIKGKRVHADVFM